MDLDFIFGQRLSNCKPKDPPPDDLIGFADNNLAKDPKDRKLVIGYCFFLNGAIVSWYSKKQRTISTSIMEAEYIALEYASKK